MKKNYITNWTNVEIRDQDKNRGLSSNVFRLI